jgi:hypothetical protein
MMTFYPHFHNQSAQLIRVPPDQFVGGTYGWYVRVHIGRSALGGDYGKLSVETEPFGRTNRVEAAVRY